ncbi:GNAT family N-acetyltransferase [Methanobrevibacter smithii]|jgi:ribosomal protein S18 acetylase RimI-like enzyme|uniref:GNAT family N-acetyltransferase n=1 Tax=Methanobrevibacter smithii TaxID=2173 RepID=UPI001FCC3728|nr:GNAT family N-acetyltransferase [Methanobrevibacter smithii]MBS6827612.1 GNAT family N-acetyltransferase [Methanobrevibacter smithii]BDF80965.1 N-acetyltransferase [Methanobrevibacter smithii]BDF82444.1 N-acetyltransferase [Methanobrevibacter smithii]HJJ02467.1 GNAT family N-acetyltransferase [Methanobrevibacter smithii]
MIRLASIRDIRGINELLLQVQKVHSDIRPDLFKYIGTKYNDSELEGIIKNSETPVFVYESDNKVVGYVFCIVTNYHNDTSFCDHKTIYIDDLCVDENARHKGIGTALYEYVLEYAKSIGCHNVTLNVWEGNGSAIKFYENIGMKIQKVSMEQIL